MLKLNLIKTKAIMISRKRNPPQPSLVVDDTPIEQVDSLPYLGVTISSDLSWSTHITNICTKAR